MTKRKAKKTKAEAPSLLELLDRVEAEITRLRIENKRLAAVARSNAKMVVKSASGETALAKPPALGKGLSQLLGARKQG